MDAHTACLPSLVLVPFAEQVVAATPELCTWRQGILPELNARQKEALQALLLLGAKGERRARSLCEVVRKVDPSAKEVSFKKDLAALVKRGLAASKKGPGGGFWLTAEGITIAEQI
jgi:hypothetical protein